VTVYVLLPPIAQNGVFSHFGAIEAGGIAVGIKRKYKKKQYHIV